jgi:CRISPR/Cas system-associated exonuclease Cas4 (RecB family)
MTLPSSFLFNQGNLQDFVDCRRRFQLRYVQDIAWPAVDSEPVLENERLLRRGQDFHHMIYQYLCGVPEQMILSQAIDPELERWWKNALKFLSNLHLDPNGAGVDAVSQPSLFATEISLSAPILGHRLMAQFDLLLFDQGKTTIFDWKASRKRPKRSWLAERMQTRVYPYVLVCAGKELNSGQAILPEQVEMVYWFAENPLTPERFEYSAAHFERDAEYLAKLVAEILDLPESQFTMTSQSGRCAYCTYRSFCDRGVEAGMSNEFAERGESDPSQITIDFEQIGEIEF